METPAPTESEVADGGGSGLTAPQLGGLLAGLSILILMTALVPIWRCRQRSTAYERRASVVGRAVSCGPVCGESALHAVSEPRLTRFSGAIRRPQANASPPAGSSPPPPYSTLWSAYPPLPPAAVSRQIGIEGNERNLDEETAGDAVEFGSLSPPIDRTWLHSGGDIEPGARIGPIGGASPGGFNSVLNLPPDEESAEVAGAAEDPLEGLPEEAIAALSLGAKDDLPPPRKSILTASLGPGPAKYVSIAHAVELELEAGSLEEEVPLEISITQGLAFVECPIEKGSCRAPPFDDTSTEEFLAMTFVHGPEGVTFSEDKPAKLRFFLGCVDDLAPTGDGADQVVITDEEIERDVLEAYRPLTSSDGVNNWTTHGPYSVVFLRLRGQREVWVETAVTHFSVKSNAKKIDKAAKGQDYYYGDLGGWRWGFKGRSSVPVVRFGNNTTERWATFTQYPIVQHTEASSEREVYAEFGAVEATAGGGVRQQSSAVGGVLASAGEIITTKVKSGMYEDSEMSCDVKAHLQMNVRVGVLQDLTGKGLRLKGKLQLLDAKKISGNKVLVLREPRLEGLTEYEQIDWPCSAEAICNIQVSTVAGTTPASVGPAWEPTATIELEVSAAPTAREHSGSQSISTASTEV